MKVKDLIIQLLELPLDSSIGIANYDENDELWVESTIDLIDNTKDNIKSNKKVVNGDKYLSYYLI